MIQRGTWTGVAMKIFLWSVRPYSHFEVAFYTERFKQKAKLPHSVMYNLLSGFPLLLIIMSSFCVHSILIIPSFFFFFWSTFFWFFKSLWSITTFLKSKSIAQKQWRICTKFQHLGVLGIWACCSVKQPVGNFYLKKSWPSYFFFNIYWQREHENKSGQ